MEATRMEKDSVVVKSELNDVINEDDNDRDIQSRGESSHSKVFM